jgi:hypothetical protein
VELLHDRTGSLTAVTRGLAAFAIVTLLCALFSPDRPEELRPEAWQAAASSRSGMAAAAE